MNQAVQARNLVKRYKSMQRNAVDGLTFHIAAGAVIGLLGPNGAGKTTLIKLICGVTVPSQGSVEVFGANPAAHGGAAKRGIGVVHQSGPFDMMLPAIDNLRIAARFKGLRWRDIRHRVDELLAAFGLDTAVSQLTFTLSGGELKRLQVIRALLGDPSLLLLDEPSAGLDVNGRRQVWALLDELRRQYGTTVLWTSHYVEELERNCQQVLIVNHGRLVKFAAPRDLAEQFGGHAALLSLARPHDTNRLAALLGQPELQVTVSGRRVEVSGRDVRALLPTLLTAARALGIGIDTIEYRTPSLEDAFLELVGTGHDT
ncbi:ABC transporter ATP-binding protein [Streptomyces olivoreticuli]|uniref:ABC transporter ATP-binding protein n=1 Tax=Streptomyces olivoreticuli TaxID=68246 RepID=UPI000E260954|nr:ABC transporter ATP-binding protein [Streptomyces olivoreticuli]